MTAFARNRHLLDFAVSSLLRQRGRTILITLVYATIVALLGSVLLFGAALRGQASAQLAVGPDIVVQAMVMGRHDFVTATDLDMLRSLRGVRRAEARLWGYLYDNSTAANYTLMADPELSAGEAAIGEGVARLRKLDAGKPLFMVSPAGKLVRLKVASVIASESALVSSDLVLMNEADLRAFFSVPPGVYTDLALFVANPQEVAKIAEKGASRLPGHRFVTRADLARSYEALFNWREGVVLMVMACAIIAFAIFAFDKASGLSAEERREIGILKAIGWDTSDVIALKLMEGAIVSGTAFLLGFTAAYAHVFLFRAGLFEPVLIGWSSLYPHFRLSPDIDGLQVATLALLTVLPYFAAILVPVWRSASADPGEVMR
ncbi:FtsX-like permease family protein [Bradyrhizobium ontarionense]|uniref:FtsX-like permease family protein n=1 Tax=Bradyrhizobium ontarionense TaxID=2898149 RepID=A0ABY3R6D2_9BRAD|nr:FtsX-like permease family protein [Bradyrhizobium sp. A19]UFZ02704.1 FtsX-like permease family protein [Bradyrhizobium sp. A19]